MGSTFYDIDGHPCTFAEWLQTGDERKILARTTLADGSLVSTVWRGIDHNFSGDGPPMIFETMVFTDDESADCVRYSTRESALAGHAAMVDKWSR